VVLTSRTWRSGSPLTSGVGVTQMWGSRREMYAAVRVTLWCAHGGSNKRKSGCVVAYLGSFTLTSCMSTMSVVGPAVFSSVVRVVALRFVLWDTIRRVAADDLYLFISGHGSVSDRVGFGRDVFQGDCLRSCFLPGFSYCVDFNGASGVVCGVLGVGMSHGGTVRTLVFHLDALAAFHSGTFSILVVFGGVSGGADCAGGSVICCVGCVVMSEFLTSAVLVNGACGEELCDFVLFKQDNHFCMFEEVVLLPGLQGDHYARGGLTDPFVGVRDVPWGLS
jgi:hypothetical protein